MRRPRYPLSRIKAAFSSVGRVNWTFSAKAGALELDMGEEEVIDVIAALTGRDFDKSMRSEANPTVWQDVYKPMVGGVELYVKFTLDAQGALYLISFKENRS